MWHSSKRNWSRSKSWLNPEQVWKGCLPILQHDEALKGFNLSQNYSLSFDNLGAGVWHDQNILWPLGKPLARGISVALKPFWKSQLCNFLQRKQSADFQSCTLVSKRSKVWSANFKCVLEQKNNFAQNSLKNYFRPSFGQNRSCIRLWTKSVVAPFVDFKFIPATFFPLENVARVGETNFVRMKGVRISRLSNG